MSFKQETRLRRAKRSRHHIRSLQVKDADLPRLTVHRTPRHISAQIMLQDPLTRQTVVIISASTQESEIKQQCKYTGNADAAKTVGKILAERAKKAGAKGLPKVAFDRSGFQYHGRVKALADGAREGGLDF